MTIHITPNDKPESDGGNVMSKFIPTEIERMRRTDFARSIRVAAEAIGGASWDDIVEDGGTLRAQLDALASLPNLGSDGDLTREDRLAIADLIRAVEEDADTHLVATGIECAVCRDDRTGDSDRPRTL